MSGVAFFVHDSVGRILRTGVAPSDMVAMQARGGETAVVGSASDFTQYVDNGVVTDKLPLGAALDKTSVTGDGVDYITLSSLPVPTTVSVYGPAHDSIDVLDGTLELTFPLPGVYIITCYSLHRLSQEFTVNAS